MGLRFHHAALWGTSGAAPWASGRERLAQEGQRRFGRRRRRRGVARELHFQGAVEARVAQRLRHCAKIHVAFTEREVAGMEAWLEAQAERAAGRHPNARRP